VADPTTVFSFVPAQLPPTPQSDLYLERSTFLTSFATGVGRSRALALWASQRPVTLGALNEPSGTPAWDTIPSWYLIGTRDRVIPPSAQLEMARKAGSTIAYFKAGHLGLITDPGAVTRVITAAVRATR
jgi:pimeloyl-ACP methyl ester carboxylesterase